LPGKCWRLTLNLKQKTETDQRSPKSYSVLCGFRVGGQSWPQGDTSNVIRHSFMDNVNEPQKLVDLADARSSVENADC
jgi:hypothetical protein